ncbi:MAG TPA: DedA family protein [Bacillota bacterium]|jgi:membrane protein DedA with SNARE-associated domain
MELGILGGWAGTLFDWAMRYGYWGILVASSLEGTGLPVPIEIPFAVAGILIVQGKMSFPMAWAVAAIGETIGNLGGYWIGYWGGQAFIERYGARFGITQKELARVSDWFARYGGGTIVLARWFGIIRTPTIIASGLAKMRLDVYVVYSLIAEASWTAGWLWLFYAFGGRWHIILRFVRPHLAALASVALVAGFGYWLWRRNRRRDPIR